MLIPTALLYTAFKNESYGLMVAIFLLWALALIMLYVAVIDFTWKRLSGQSGDAIWASFGAAGGRLLPVLGVGLLLIISFGLGFGISAAAIILSTIWLLVLPIVVIERDRSAMDSFGRSATLLAGSLWRTFWASFLVQLVFGVIAVIAFFIIVEIDSAFIAGLLFAFVMAALIPISPVFSTVVYADRLAVVGGAPSGMTPPQPSLAGSVNVPAPPPPAPPQV